MNLPLRLARRLLDRVEREPRFATADVVVGRDVTFGRNVVFNCRSVRLGDGVSIGDNAVFNATTLDIGDFASIYPYCFFPGPGDLRIGHNFWLGTASIIDSRGGTTIGNNVGIGAHSQLWTHMVYGDLLAGCRFHSVKPLTIGDDVWLVGHCLVSPVTVGDRSLAMLGSVVVRDMLPDRCYGGVPASDITERVGPQFGVTSAEERAAMLRRRIEALPEKLAAAVGEGWLRIADRPGDRLGSPPGVTVVNVADRTYTKTGSRRERQLIRQLLPDVKLVPVSERAASRG